MAKKRAYICFDFDNDSDLKVLLAGQAKHPDSPFDITDMSIKEAVSKNWEDNARRRIKGCDVVIVMCGEHTDTARGVSIELKIAQDESISYFLLEGRVDKTCKKPTAAKSSDKMYSWTWDNLKKLINGSR